MQLSDNLKAFFKITKKWNENLYLASTSPGWVLIQYSYLVYRLK